MEDYRRCQIPAFGNWDYSDNLPITQYFESARQAGLIRYNDYGVEDQDLYGESLKSSGPTPVSLTKAIKQADFTGIHVFGLRNNKEKQINNVEPIKLADYVIETSGTGISGAHCFRVLQQVKGGSKRYQYVKEAKKVGKVCDVTEPPRIPRAPKAVDEDLYKIPPELLCERPRKSKFMGFLSRCLVPDCTA